MALTSDKTIRVMLPTDKLRVLYNPGIGSWMEADRVGEMMPGAFVQLDCEGSPYHLWKGHIQATYGTWMGVDFGCFIQSPEQEPSDATE